MVDDPQSLIRAAARGDEAAFESLYQLYYRPLYRYIVARTGEPEVAEDLTQSTFIKLHRRITSSSNPLHPGYFYTAARNAVVDHYRASSNKPVEASEEVLERLPDPAITIEAQIIEKQQFDLVQAAIRQLPSEQQDVIILRYIDGLSGRETAEALGKSEEATRQLQTRALKNLRKLIGSTHE